MPTKKKSETKLETLSETPVVDTTPNGSQELAAEKRAIEKEKKALEARRSELNEVQAQIEEDRSALATLWQEYEAAQKGALAKVKKLKAKLEKAEKKIKKLKKKN